jgi:HPt (histidine-containing phosphotransfer) domain-containing protein
MVAVWQLIQAIVHSGEQKERGARAQRRVVVNNTISFILLLNTWTYIPPLWLLGLKGLALSLIPTGLIYALPVVFARAGRFATARAILFTAPICVVFFYFSAIGLRGEVSLFYVCACLPLVFCSLEDRKSLAFGIVASVTAASIVFLAGDRYMGRPLLSPGADFIMRLVLVAGTFAILLAIVLSFVVSNARAEQKLEIAHAGIQRLLDSVDQGFVTLDPKGRVEAQRSAVFDRWFGAPAAGSSFAACLERLAPTMGEIFEAAWSQLEIGWLPMEVSLNQLPAQIQSAERFFELFYKPELDGPDRLKNLLVVITDVTSRIERKRSEANQNELLALMARFTSDRNGFREFLREAESLVGVITAPGVDQAELKRAVHTLKGNCALFGAQVVASHCHEFESRLTEVEGEISELDRRSLAAIWGDLRARMHVFLGEESDTVTVDRAEFEEVRQKVRAGTPTTELAALLDTWTWEPTAKRLSRIADQVHSLGKRLDKPEIDVELDAGGLRLNAERWANFWSSFAHVVRNGVDHGIESREERAAASKLERARIAVRTRLEGNHLVVEFADDGRGIDWDKVTRKATERGLDAGSHTALVRAIFLDSFSTHDEVTELSGRGVGLGAVRAACDELDGTIAVESERGRGSLFRFTFPADGVVTSRLSVSPGSRPETRG